MLRGEILFGGVGHIRGWYGKGEMKGGEVLLLRGIGGFFELVCFFGRGDT